MLQLHLHSRLNTWPQWFWQRQPQDWTRNISVVEFGALIFEAWQYIQITSKFSCAFEGYAHGFRLSVCQHWVIIPIFSPFRFIPAFKYHHKTGHLWNITHIVDRRPWLSLLLLYMSYHGYFNRAVHTKQTFGANAKTNQIDAYLFHSYKMLS